MTMTVKEAEDTLKKAKTPGSVFLCGDPKLFDLNRLIGSAEGFLACHEKMKPLAEQLKRCIDGTCTDVSAQYVVDAYRRDVLGLEGK